MTGINWIKESVSEGPIRDWNAQSGDSARRRVPGIKEWSRVYLHVPRR